jgi:hypothetical protein
MASLGVAVLRFDNVTYAHRREVKKAHDYQLWNMGRTGRDAVVTDVAVEEVFTRSSVGTVLLTRSSEHDFWDWSHVGSAVEPCLGRGVSLPGL